MRLGRAIEYVYRNSVSCESVRSRRAQGRSSTVNCHRTIIINTAFHSSHQCVDCAPSASLDAWGWSHDGEVSLIAGQLQDRVVPIRQRITADCWATTVFGSSHCPNLFWSVCAFVCAATKGHRFVTEAVCSQGHSRRWLVLWPRHFTMFSLLSGLVHYMFSRPEFFALVVGLDNAGKTVSCPSPARSLTPTTQSHVCTHTSACTHSRVVASVGVHQTTTATDWSLLAKSTRSAKIDRMLSVGVASGFSLWHSPDS